MNKKVLIGVITLVIIVAMAILGYFVMLKIEQNKVESTIEDMFTNLKSGENNNQKQEVLEQLQNNSNQENSTKDTIE